MDETRGRHPTGWLLLAGLGWYVAVCVLLAVGLGADRVVNTGGGLVGGAHLVSGVGEQAAVVPILLGLAIAVLAVLAGLGQGWAVVPLVGAGALSVLGLAIVGSWLALPAMGSIVVGVAPIMTRSVQDHLWAPDAINLRSSARDD